MEALVNWTWPGNIRELENFLERAVILTRGTALFAPLAELESPEKIEKENAQNPNASRVAGARTQFCAYSAKPGDK